MKQGSNYRFAEPTDRNARLQIGHPTLHQFTVQ